MKLRVKFKDPDLIGEYLDQAVPGDYDDPKVEAARDKLSRKYFEFGDYGGIEIDTEKGTGRLLTVKEWGRL